MDYVVHSPSALAVLVELREAPPTAWSAHASLDLVVRTTPQVLVGPQLILPCALPTVPAASPTEAGTLTV